MVETATGAPLLSVRDLSVEFAGRRTVRAVRGISYDLARGETMGIVGESGSGKSVSALSLLGLLPQRVGRITGGSIKLEGRELVGLPEGELMRIRGGRIGMIFQDPLSSLNPVLTIGRRGPSSCWSSWASPTRHGASTSTRTSSAAACASAP